MTNFPTNIDDDTTLYPVFDNITEIGGTAINQLRSAIFAIENNIGLVANGSTASIASRLNVSINADGSLKASALTAAGLVSLPIFDFQISANAQIQESKIKLNYTTQYLKNLIDLLNSSVQVLDNWLSVTGVKVEPHIAGTNYRHKLSHIDVDNPPGAYKNAPIANLPTSGTSVVSRNIFNADTLVKDINDDLVVHEKSDGTQNITVTSGGTIPPINYAHMAAGVFIDTSRFSTIPTTINDAQQFANFVDNSSLLLLGGRTQTLFSNGISRSSRSSVLWSDIGGQQIVSPTPCTAYLLFSGSNNPVDDISHGDDIILFNPPSSVLSNSVFDAQFALVKPGDIIVINYNNGTPQVSFTIDGTRAIINGSSRTYEVRINGKNIYSSSTATASIYKTFYNENKYGELALGVAHNFFGVQDTLIAGQPRSASALGLGFSPDQIDSTHYNLYLMFYPTGNPLDAAVALPPIDITGNQGITPGQYTLDSLIAATNKAFRQPGYNYRFMAFSYKGEFGIMLADPYNDASFSIISGVVNSTGSYDSSSLLSYPNNIVDNYNNIDPLGFGLNGAVIASPPYSSSYTNPIAAQVPTLFFAPLKRKYYYVNGAERERFNQEVFTILDGYGDGYWIASITNQQSFGSRIETTYTVNLDLSTSSLKVGKTLVVQPAIPVGSSGYNQNDYGRFIIDNVVFNNCPGPSPTTLITVYDAVAGVGISPAPVSPLGTQVLIYFNDDSVAFDAENVSDPSISASFKRYFEILGNQYGRVFSHERARLNLSGSNLTVDATNGFILYSTSEMSYVNIYEVSPKLRGYKSLVYSKIHLFLTSYDGASGVFTGYLCKYDGSTYSHFGTTVTGKKGEITRFYDESNVDYIDVVFDFSDSISSFVNRGIDIQLFPSLALNEEKIFFGSCQVNDSSKSVDHIRDGRQFGNTSEKQLSTSAIDFINSANRLTRENGLVVGFDVQTPSGAPLNQIFLTGGTALINGKVVNSNETISILPAVQETLYPSFSTTTNTINWFVCLNDKGKIELVANADYLPTLSAFYGSLDQNRVFYVQNPNAISPSPYAVRSGYLAKIMTSYKDLLPLYMITSIVAQVSGKYVVNSIRTYDLRRYVANGYGGLNNPFVLGPNGSFRSFDTLNTYLNLLNNYVSGSTNSIGNRVLVKGITNITSTETLNYSNKVSFIGDYGGFNVSVATGFEIRNNVEFDGINFTYNYDATSDPSYSSASLINYANGCIHCLADAVNGNQNITIKNCTFTSSNILNKYAFMAFNLQTNTCQVQNVVIKDNIFNISLPPIGPTEDYSAVIAFVGPSTSPSSTSSARLINCVIDGNITNKNNMIAVAGYYSAGLGKIVDAINPINVKITNNICGSINFLTRRGGISTVANSTFNDNKESSMLIANNNCKLIFTGTHTGSVTTSSITTISGEALNTGLFSANTIIENNSAHWIQYGIRVPNIPNLRNVSPTIVLKNNKLTAYNPAYLSSYYQYSAGGYNTAIISHRTVGT